MAVALLALVALARGFAVYLTRRFEAGSGRLVGVSLFALGQLYPAGLAATVVSVCSCVAASFVVVALTARSARLGLFSGASVVCILALLAGGEGFHSGAARPALARPSVACRSVAPCAAAVEGVLKAEDEMPAPGSLEDRVDAVYRFSRPHTIRGTLLASFTGVGRALVESPMYLGMLPALLPTAMLGVAALLLGNLFIVGINQIYDVDIDQVNKPFLPMAAGQMSPRFAWAVVLGSLGAGMALVRAFFSPLIFRLYAFGMAVGMTT